MTGECAPSRYTVCTGVCVLQGRLSVTEDNKCSTQAERRTDANIAVTCGTVVQEAGGEEILQAPLRATERA